MRKGALLGGARQWSFLKESYQPSGLGERKYASLAKRSQPGGRYAEKPPAPAVDKGTEQRKECALSCMLAAESRCNPLAAGGDDEQSFVMLQRLNLDCLRKPKGEGAVGLERIRHFALTQLYERRYQHRQQIDLSYMPDGQTEEVQGLKRTSRQQSRADTACSVLLQTCFPPDSQDVSPFDSTVQNLQQELSYLQQWGKALQDATSLPDKANSSCLSLVNQQIFSHHFAVAEGTRCKQQEKKLKTQRKTAEREAVVSLLRQYMPQQEQQGEIAVPRGLRRPPFTLPIRPKSVFQKTEKNGSNANLCELLNDVPDFSSSASGHASFSEKDEDDKQTSVESQYKKAAAELAEAARGRVKGLAQFYEGVGEPVSQRVKTLELDCRTLLTKLKKSVAERDRAKEQLKEACRKKNQMEKSLKQKLHIIRQREEAVRLTIEDHLSDRRILERELEEKKEAVQMKKEEVAMTKLSQANIAASLTKSEVVRSAQEKDIEQLKVKLSSLQKENQSTAAQRVEEQRFYQEDRLKLEHLHFRCECLGEDRLRLIEALRREKATRDLREAEIHIYKKYLADLSAERNFLYQACEDAQRKFNEEKVQTQARFRKEIMQKVESLEKETALHVESTKKLKQLQLELKAKDKQILQYALLNQGQQDQIQAQEGHYNHFLRKLDLLAERLGTLSSLTQLLEKNKLKSAAKLVPQIATRTRGTVGSNFARQASRRALVLNRQPRVTSQIITQEFSNAARSEAMLSVDQAVASARKLGLAPSDKDISSLRAKTNSLVDREAFANFCIAAEHPEDASESMSRFFNLWDSAGSGELSAKQMKFLLQSFGEPLTEEEANFAVEYLGGGATNINYQEFCAKLLSVKNRESDGQSF